MNLSNLNIGTRLALGFGVVLILLMLVLGIGLINLSSINDAIIKIVESNNVKVDAVNNMRDAQRQAGLATRNIVLLTDDAEMAEQGKNIGAA
jgi:methyl-accepting chemotaxis protein